jgi:hypothetical protein
MPIFISYSQKDKTFADTLATNLVLNKHHVWMDRWELNVGDSLLDRIQSVLTTSSAILVLLSKNSVESEWCRRELNAGLMRELEEKKTLLMPCVIDNCTVPLFLRDKIYADFRTDPDEALEQVNRALAQISNPRQGRAETPVFKTDWSLDWKSLDETHIMEWTFVDHGHDWPYVVLSQCAIICNENASRRFAAAEASGETDAYMRDVLTLLVDSLPDGGLTVRIEDARQQSIGTKLKGVGDEAFAVRFSYRRLGQDNGFDTVVYLDNNLRTALEHMRSVSRRPTREA